MATTVNSEQLFHCGTWCTAQRLTCTRWRHTQRGCTHSTHLDRDDSNGLIGRSIGRDGMEARGPAVDGAILASLQVAVIISPMIVLPVYPRG